MSMALLKIILLKDGCFLEIKLIRKKADIQQIVWHLDVGLSFPKSVVPRAQATIDSPISRENIKNISDRMDSSG